MYFKDASSINFVRSVVYALGVLLTAIIFRLQKNGVMDSKLFDKKQMADDSNKI